MAFILDDILLAPVTFPTWISRKIGEAAHKEMTDDSAIRQELLQLQMRFELGEIDDQEYDRRETHLLERLERARKLKEEGPPL